MLKRPCCACPVGWPEASTEDFNLDPTIPVGMNSLVNKIAFFGTPW